MTIQEVTCLVRKSGAELRCQEPVSSATRELKQEDHTNSREHLNLAWATW